MTQRQINRIMRQAGWTVERGSGRGEWWYTTTLPGGLRRADAAPLYAAAQAAGLRVVDTRTHGGASVRLEAVDC